MGFGPTELSILLVFLVIGAAAIALQIYAAVKAFNDGENGWGVGILVAMLVPLGFIVAIVYLVQRKSRVEL
ncbi:MAG TPA: hypothetical protein VMZ22_12145 [Acidimicrobiales bacterium]|nr:hypothetical protein [Acidimicrobiales bacterium]